MLNPSEDLSDFSIAPSIMVAFVGIDLFMEPLVSSLKPPNFDEVV